MRQLLEKNTKWEWTEERNTDFNKIKKELTSQPCLAHYNGNKENIVTTDACGTGLGIALWQKQSNGDLKPIAFASRYFNDAEKKFSRRTRTTGGSMGIRTVQISPIRKTSSIILRPPSPGTAFEEE